MATKIEAFKGRGEGDFLASRDIEDIIAVVDGRSELLDEVNDASPELRAYLSTELGAWIDERELAELIPCHLPGDAASQARAGLVLERFSRIAGRAQGRPR